MSKLNVTAKPFTFNINAKTFEFKTNVNEFVPSSTATSLPTITVDEADNELLDIINEENDENYNNYQEGYYEEEYIDNNEYDNNEIKKQSYSRDYLLNYQHNKPPMYLDVAMTQSQEQLSWINQQENRLNSLDMPLKGSRRTDAYSTDIYAHKIAGRRDLTYQQDLHVARRKDVITYNRSFLLQFKSLGPMILPPGLAHLTPRAAGGNITFNIPTHLTSISGNEVTLVAAVKKKKVDEKLDRKAPMRSISTPAATSNYSNKQAYSVLATRKDHNTSKTDGVRATPRWLKEGGQDEKSVAEKQIRTVLNKLAPEHFNELLTQAAAIEVTEVKTMQVIVDSIFEKAISESGFAELYARFCVEYNVLLPEIPDGSGTVNFSALLTKKCFLNIVNETDRVLLLSAKQRSTPSMKAVPSPSPSLLPMSLDKMRSPPSIVPLVPSTPLPPMTLMTLERSSTEEDTAKRSEATLQEQALRKRTLGTMVLIGELCKTRLLAETVIFVCISQSLDNMEDPDEYDLESVCQLLLTAGSFLDTPKNQLSMNVCIEKLSALVMQSKFLTTPNAKSVTLNKTFRPLKKPLSTRVRFMLEGIIELRENGWVPRREKEIQPKMLKDIKKAETEIKAPQRSVSVRDTKTPSTSLAQKSALMMANINTAGNRQAINTTIKKSFLAIRSQSQGAALSSAQQPPLSVSAPKVNLMRSVSDKSEPASRNLMDDFKSIDMAGDNYIVDSKDDKDNKDDTSEFENDVSWILEEYFGNRIISEAVLSINEKSLTESKKMTFFCFKSIYLAFDSNKVDNRNAAKNLIVELFKIKLLTTDNIVKALTDITDVFSDFDVSKKLVLSFFTEFISNLIDSELISYINLKEILILIPESKSIIDQILQYLLKIKTIDNILGMINKSNNDFTIDIIYLQELKKL